LGQWRVVSVGNEKKGEGSQHLSESGIERAEGGFSSAGSSRTSPFCREPWGKRSPAPWVLHPWLCAGVGLGAGGLTWPNRVCRCLPPLFQPQPRCNPLAFFSGICLYSDFNFSFSFSSSSTGCFPVQSSRAELSLWSSMAVPSHGTCFLNRNPTGAASRFCTLLSGNLLNDSLQISFVSCAYYYMCSFQSTTCMETWSIFNIDIFSKPLCCRQNWLKWVNIFHSAKLTGLANILDQWLSSSHVNFLTCLTLRTVNFCVYLIYLGWIWHANEEGENNNDA